MASMTNTLLSSNCFSSQVLLSSPTPQNFTSLPTPYRKFFVITQSIHNKNPNSQSIINNFPTQATLASLPFSSITPQALAVDTNPPPHQIQSQPTNQTPSFSQNPLLTAPKPPSTSDLPEGSQWRYSEFLNAAKKGEVERVRFSKDGEVLRLTAFDGRRASVTVPNDPDLIDSLAMNGVDISEGESGSSFAASLSTSQLIARGIIRGMAVRSSCSVPRVKASAIIKYDADWTPVKRRDVIHMAFSFSSFLIGSSYAEATGLPPEEKPKLCDNTCEKELENVSMVTTPSGLQYKDIKIGAGPSPPIGFQVAANYVAMVPSGQIFDSSLEKGQIYIFRVGSGQVIKGLDEGVLSMKTGGKRRLYIPGSLAFPKGLISAPGRPRVAPNSPVIFDVSLEYIPGLDDEE